MGCVRDCSDKRTNSGEKAIHPYYLDNGILMKYVTDHKQRFEVTVVPPEWGPMLLKLAHDDLGHNGTAAPT